MNRTAFVLTVAVMISLVAYGQGLPQTFPANVGLYINKPLGPGILVGGGGDIGENPPIAFLNPHDTTHIKAMINNQGAFYTNAWIVVSGGFDATINSQGLLTTANYAQTGIPTMIEVLGDIPGPSILTKAAPTGGSYNFLGLDRNKNYTFTVEENGALQFGAGKTKESMDLSISRTAGPILNLNVLGAPVLKLSAGAVNIPTIPQTGGVRYACFDGNGNLINSATNCTDTLVKAIQAQQVEIDALKQAIHDLRVFHDN